MTETPLPRSMRKDALRNRERIVTSAHVVFGAQGIAATLDDVAHQAGLGVGTVYRHFPHKQDLVEAMFADRVNMIVEMASAALEADDPWRGFVDFCATAAETFAADRGLYDVMLSSRLGGPDVAATRAKVLSLCDRLVTRAQQSGQLRKDFSAAEFPLLHLMIGTVADYMHDVGPQVWRRYVDIFLDGLRADRASAPLPVPPPDNEMVDMASRRWRPHRPNVG